MLRRASSSTCCAHDFDAALSKVRTLQRQLDREPGGSLAERTLLLRQQGRIELDSWDLQLEAAAIGAEAIKRTVGFQLHDTQIQGALATSIGAIVEMRTGEGKTLACGLAAFIRSIFDRSVHVATTNQYLAHRDHEQLSGLFQLTQTSTAVLEHESRACETRAAYRSDITYGAGYLFGFDYLRDQLALRAEEKTTLGRDVLNSINGRDPTELLLQPERATIIVDEADCVLVDEATTPLILSGGADGHVAGDKRAFGLAATICESLVSEEHFRFDRLHRRVSLTNQGKRHVHERLMQEGRMPLARPWCAYIENALCAHHLLRQNEHYVVEQNRIKLVDQNTGRIFDDRTLRNGLHQAVEAKEKVAVRTPQRSVARITRQRFFQLYDRVCGLTATANENENEFGCFYDAPVVTVPPHHVTRQINYPTRLFVSWETKLRAIVSDVVDRLAVGQPILVGTKTIAESLKVEKALSDARVPSIVLNGVQDEQEAEIIQKAGRSGRVTVATNMAGRGTDIKLTEESRLAGGLHVIGMQRHLSRRTDRQLAGRSARQGEPGSCQFFVSVDDELISLHGQRIGDIIRKAADELGECKRNLDPELEKLQTRLEEQAFAERKLAFQRDNAIDSIRSALVSDQ